MRYSIEFRLIHSDCPIVINDISDLPLNEYSTQLKDILKGNTITTLTTDTDCLILRPSQISTIKITEIFETKKHEDIIED